MWSRLRVGGTPKNLYLWILLKAGVRPGGGGPPTQAPHDFKQVMLRSRIRNRDKTKITTVSKKAKDNLQKIEGIGPKIAELLTKAGIKTFTDLSAAKKTTLKSILEAAGSRYKMHDPSTWAKQAKLAAKGKWDKLATLQDELSGGRKK